MEIQQLKFFLKVAECRNFTVAATDLNISQSSLSKHIKALEEEVGIKLIERSTRSLTEAGIYFSGYASKIIEDYDVMQLNMNQYKKINKKVLSIGTIPVMSQYGINSLIAGFKKQNEDIDIHIVEGRSPEILSLLDASKIDLAFIRTISIKENNYNVNSLIDDDLVLIVPKGHPFTRNLRMDLSLAEKENFILLDSGKGINDLCMEACRESGFEPCVLFEYSRIETIIGTVAEGLGVSLLMRKVVEFFNNTDIQVIELTRKYTTTLALVEVPHKKDSVTMKLFREFTKEWFEKLGTTK
ncbi:MAG: LysR family transcriptional regulator [Mobilitalea sp.]